MTERMLSSVDPNMTFEHRKIFAGEALPALSDIDGALITGSPAGVYEGHDWIPPLETFIRECSTVKRPLFGICFGHQVMAQALGGKVEQSNKGWGVGVHRYRLNQPASWMEPTLGEIACAVSHKDQVLERPENAQCFGGSDFCENGVLVYENAPLASFQMHPEFEHGFAEELAEARKDRIGHDLISEARTSLKGHSDRNTMARWIAQFFTENT